VTLVVDAGVVVTACLSAPGLSPLGPERLVGPPLLWSEARSTLHELRWRDEIDAGDAEAAREALETSDVERVDDPRLGARAWQIADTLGWAKTYDAEYVALADLLGCRLVTLDARLRRGAARLGFVIGVDEL
jgi:predicted nucleic acid-binding protein